MSETRGNSTLVHLGPWPYCSTFLCFCFTILKPSLDEPIMNKLKWYPNKQTRTWNFCSWKLEFGIDSPKPLQNLHCPDPIYGWEAVTTDQGFRRFKPRRHCTDASAAAMAAAETEGRQLKASVSLVTDPGAVKAAGWALPLTKSWDSKFWNQKNASSEIVGKNLTTSTLTSQMSFGSSLIVAPVGHGSACKPRVLDRLVTASW